MMLKQKRIHVLIGYAIGVGAFTLTASTVQAQQPERITITGSSISRVATENALPIQVISQEDIKRSGVTTTADLMDKLSSNSGGYNVSVGVGDSGQPGFSGASMRGLGSSNTLVLLNGRRVANYAFNGGAVDLNSISLAAVERVEILKDGASAIYGTDAIGGVINFILRKDFKGAEVSAYTTDTKHGGGNTNKVTATFGYGDLQTQKFNVFLAIDGENSQALHATQRDFAKTGIRPDLGFSKTSGNSYPANFTYAGGPGTLNPAAATGCVPALGSYHINPSTGAPSTTRNDCRFDYSSQLDIFPPVERQSVLARGVFQLSADHQAFAEFMQVDNKTRFASSQTPINDFTGNGPFLYPAGGKYYPTSVTLANGTVVHPTGDLTLAFRGVASGLRTDEAVSKANRFIVGLEGVVSGWDYNTAFSQSKSKVDDNYVDGWLYESKMKAVLLTGNVNPFGPQDAAGNALLQSAKILGLVRTAEGKTTSWDGKISREIAKMASGPLELAIGAEHRKEELSDIPQPVFSSGDILGGGGNLQKIGASRTVNALFTELNVPLRKDLTAQLAVRYDDYSDVGSTTNPKIGLRYQPTKSVLVRGSYNTGFRAPTLPDLFSPNYRGNTADNHNDPIRCPNGVPVGPFVNAGLECDAQMPNQGGGNPKLQPEKSTQWSLGTVLELAKGWVATADYWSIERKNSINSLGDNTLFGNYAKYSSQYFVRRPSDNNVGIPGPIDYVIQTQQNLGKYKTEGLDLNVAWTLPRTSYGQFKLAIDGTLVTKYEYQTEKDGVFINNLGKYTSDNFAIPRWRHTATVNYQRGAWDATLANNFVQGYQDDGGARDVGNYSTWDAQVAWSGIKNLQLVAGIRNLLDTDPPASVQGQTFQVGYDPRFTNPLGRMIYGSFNYKFK
ncbi:MAG: TonB-dependent receptor [Betaproteobacteria bacterium]|nr:TonB-dependent receptor [Betaproteobacteria bacterium]